MRGRYYHVYSRGNEKKDIFKNRRDREKFLWYLEDATTRDTAVIHAYCLMSNHFHLLVETPRANLSKIMQHINTSYTTYYNVKHQHAGHLLQGRYKAIVVEADSYACELSRYIHLNPVRAGLAPTPQHYPWSSYRSYISSAARPSWLTTSLILGYFAGREAEYQQFVQEMVDTEYRNPLQQAVASTVLGREDFVTEILDRYLSNRESEDRELPALHAFAYSASPDTVYAAVAEMITDSGEARKLAIYLCHRFCGMPLKEIGEKFNLSPSGVTQASRRFADAIERDKELERKMTEVRKRLNL